VDDSSNVFVDHAVLHPCALVHCVSARAAAKRVCELHKLSFVRERAIVRGGFVEECCSSSAASCENGGDNVKLTECFFSL
jgi:hypothetical protein